MSKLVKELEHIGHRGFLINIEKISNGRVISCAFITSDNHYVEIKKSGSYTLEVDVFAPNTRDRVFSSTEELDYHYMSRYNNLNTCNLSRFDKLKYIVSFEDFRWWVNYKPSSFLDSIRLSMGSDDNWFASDSHRGYRRTVSVESQHPQRAEVRPRRVVVQRAPVMWFDEPVTASTDDSNHISDSHSAMIELVARQMAENEVEYSRQLATGSREASVRPNERWYHQHDGRRLRF